METYICFNDESGNLGGQDRFYIRTSLIINTKNIKELQNKIKSIRKKFKLNDLKQEIKWNYIWKIKEYFEKIKYNKRIMK